MGVVVNCVMTKGTTMPEQIRPTSEKQAPDPAVNFDRSDPKRESGQGRLTNNSKATPTPRKDAMPATVTHAQAGDKQLNGEEEAAIASKSEEDKIKGESLGWEKRKS